MNDDDLEDEQLMANILNIRAALNGEQARVKFIREAAVGLDASAIKVLGHPLDAGQVWQRARELWDAKPEDC